MSGVEGDESEREEGVSEKRAVEGMACVERCLRAKSEGGSEGVPASE